MTNTTNTLEIGTRVERLGSSKDYTTGRKGEIIEIKDDRCRVKWDGSPRTWVNKKFLRILDAKPVISLDEAAFMAWKAEQAAKYDAWVKASELGTMKDDDNPAFMFNTISSQLLGMIVKGEVSTTWLAGKILAGRGQDKDGNWVGFDQAEKIHGIK